MKCFAQAHVATLREKSHAVWARISNYTRNVKLLISKAIEVLFFFEAVFVPIERRICCAFGSPMNGVDHRERDNALAFILDYFDVGVLDANKVRHEVSPPAD